jgi:hypothetical protein
MTKLTLNSFSEKYDIQVRLVTIDDAEFILQLRTNPQLNKFIHSTDISIEKQREWINEYKKRELAGIDYYFYYSRNGVPIGVNRVYDICTNKGTCGSWVCQKSVSTELPIITLIILREIMFEQLNLEYDYFDVRKQNKKVIKTHMMFGAEQINEDEQNYYYVLTKENFYKTKDTILQILL